MKNFELKVKVTCEREDGYKEAVISCGYDTTCLYTNLKCKHLDIDIFVARCIAHYIRTCDDIEK